MNTDEHRIPPRSSRRHGEDSEGSGKKRQIRVPQRDSPSLAFLTLNSGCRFSTMTHVGMESDDRTPPFQHLPAPPIGSCSVPRVEGMSPWLKIHPYKSVAVEFSWLRLRRVWNPKSKAIR